MKKTTLFECPTALSEADLSSVIGMAWSDDTPFEAIALQFGLNEGEVIALMRDQLKTRSFRVWRMRMRGRIAKHGDLQKLSMQSRNVGPYPSAHRMTLGDLQEEDFPTPSSPLTSASLR